MTKGYYCGKKDMELLIELLSMRESQLASHIRNNFCLPTQDKLVAQIAWSRVRRLLDKMRKRYTLLYPPDVTAETISALDVGNQIHQTLAGE